MDFLSRPYAEEALCLLRTTFLDAERATSAWQRWCTIGDFDDLPPGAYTLFPRLSESLQRLDVAHPFRKRLKGVQRKVWYQNQLNVQRYEQVVRLAQQHPDPLTLLYGLHFCFDDNGYAHGGLLPVRQLRLWAGKALAAYLAEHVPHQIPSLNNVIVSSKRQHWKLTDRAGLDLYFYPVPLPSHLPHQPAHPDIVTAEMGETTGRMLSLPVQTLWAAVEVIRGREAFPTTPLAETITLLEHIAATAQWEALLDVARRYQRTPHLQAVLQFVRQHLAPTIVPDSVWEALMQRRDGLAATWHFGYWHRLPSDRPFVYRVQRRLHRAIKKGA